MAAAKKTTTAKKAPAKTATAKPRAPRKTAATIRNLRGTTVHARLYSLDREKPFRIALNPRGQSGDTTTVPVNLLDDDTFIKGTGVLWEIITATEAKQIAASAPQVGYLERADAPVVIRPEDTTVMQAEDWDGKGRVPQQRQVKRIQGQEASEREYGTGMHTIDVPGSDQGLHAQLQSAQKAGESALPENVDLSSRRVAIERVRGE